ncbi:MAG: hypothetical protein RLZZ142_842 [Verrucomicrobiota bacterium]
MNRSLLWPGFLLLLQILSHLTEASEAPPKASLPEKHRAFLQSHCESCHGAEKQKGKFRVDDLSLTLSDLPSAERWQKVLNAINSGEMPPEDEKQPSATAKTDFLDDLAQTLVAARRSLSDQHGVIALRRLNRREYKNTLHALLGVHLDVSELPADTRPSGFDTVGANLFLSSSQVEAYEALAKEALEEAFTLHNAAGVSKKIRFEAENTLPSFKKNYQDALGDHSRATAWVKAFNQAVARPENAALVAELRKTHNSEEGLRHQWEKIPGVPSPELFGLPKNVFQIQGLFTVDDFVAYEHRYLQLPGLDTGAYLTHPFSNLGRASNNAFFVPGIPADWPPGEYVIRIRIGATPEAPPERRFVEFGLNHRLDQSPFLSTHHITGTREQPQILEIPYPIPSKFLKERARNLFIRERGMGSNLSQSVERFRQARAQNGFGPDFVLWVDWIEVERLPTPEDATPPGIRALAGLSLDPQSPAPSEEQFRQALERFIVEAFRGNPPRPETLTRLEKIYRSRLALGANPRVALRDTLAAVLTSPRFLYRAEPEPHETHRPHTPNELASRLSYFLWGAPPDPTLRALATSGQLAQPETLRTETERLLSDPRSAEFVNAFLSQWLSLERLDFFQFNPKRFPRFDPNTKAAARSEVTQTFAHLLKENAPLSDFLKANYVVVNGVLAQYYGLEGVQGDAFRKVALPPESPRGGLLGMAAILAMGSNGERTNPVERGAWVLRKLLNDPPPPAPANVPEITRLAGKLLTTRERLQAHQENPQCASCHRKIDPLGFGLENFDAAGQWRTEDSYTALDATGKPDPKAKKTWTIEASATLHKGPSFSGYLEMREIIAERKAAFARGFTAALLEYALGRPCGFSDEPLLDAVMDRASQHGLATREFLHALIQSPAFQSK